MSESTFPQRYATADTSTAGAFAFDTINSKDYAVSKLAFGEIGSVTYVDASNPLPVTISGVATAANQATGNALLATIAGAVSGAEVQVDIVSAPTLTIQDGGGSITVDGSVSISGSVAITAASLPLPSGAATAAKQPELGTAGAASSDVLTVQGIASMTALKVDGSAVTQPVSGTFWQATQPVSIASAVAVTDNSGSLTVDAPVGTPVFVRLSDGTSAISTLPVSLASVPSHAVTNAGTFAVQAAQSGTWTVGISSAQTLATVTTVSTVTNLSQMGGAAIAMGTGVRSSGTQRVTIATDDVVPASQSGTWTVQPGNTANTTAWIVNARPATTGGLSMHTLTSAATTNATVVKASAGQVYDVEVYNTNASPRWLKFYNLAASPTVGSSTIVRKVMIPGNTAGGGVTRTIPMGLAFSTGIAYAITTGVADSDTTAVAANEVVINLGYT